MPAGASVSIIGLTSSETDDNGYVKLNLANCVTCAPGTTLMIQVNSQYGWVEGVVTIPSNPLENFKLEVMENNELLLIGTVREKNSGRFASGVRVTAVVPNSPSIQTDNNGIFQIAIKRKGIGSSQAIKLTVSDEGRRYKDHEEIVYVNQYGPIAVIAESAELVSNPVESARALAVEEVVSNLQHLDSRLVFAVYALKLREKDAFSIKFDSVVAQVSPVFRPDHRSNYHKMLVRSDLAALRQALGAYPMPQDFGRALVQVFINGNMQEDAVCVSNYLAQFAEFQSAELGFFDAWEALATDDTCKAQVERLAANWVTVRNRADLYNLYALRLLKALKASEKSVETLRSIRILRPHQSLAQPEFEQRLLKNAQELTENVLRKFQIEKGLKKCRDRQLGVLDTIIRKLEIIPTDPPEKVQMKALTFRRLGLKDKSIAACVKYGEMFAATDSTAIEYSKTAVRFTTQLQQLAVEGGAYVSIMNIGSNIAKSSVRKNDIIITINNYPITNVDALTEALAKVSVKTHFPVEVLRFDVTSNGFKKLRFDIQAKPFGGYFLTI